MARLSHRASSEQRPKRTHPQGRITFMQSCPGLQNGSRVAAVRRLLPPNYVACRPAALMGFTCMMRLESAKRMPGPLPQLCKCNPWARSPSSCERRSLWHSRWWSLLSVAAQRAFALSLIEVDSDAIKPLADSEPRVGDILADVRYELGPVFSRLPLRG